MRNSIYTTKPKLKRTKHALVDVLGTKTQNKSGGGLVGFQTPKHKMQTLWVRKQKTLKVRNACGTEPKIENKNSRTFGGSPSPQKSLPTIGFVFWLRFQKYINSVFLFSGIGPKLVSHCLTFLLLFELVQHNIRTLRVVLYVGTRSIQSLVFVFCVRLSPKYV